jgi:HK97 family phage prohead protease
MKGKYITKDRGAIASGKKYELYVEAATEAELKQHITKALADDVPDGYVAGWASTPDIDSYNHKVVKGAFDESIASRGLRGPRGIKLLIGHNWNMLAGEIKVLEYRGNRLWMEAQMNLDIGYVSDAYKAAKMIGGVNFSVGFMLEDYEWADKKDGPDELIIKKGDLFEVSIVPFPGNEKATMTFIKSADGSDPLAKDGNAVYVDDDADETMSSVSEFEKTLVLNGVCKTRQEAHKITRLVKANLALFAPKEEPVSTPPEQQKKEGTAPMLDAAKLSAALAKMQEIQQIVSNK